MPNRALNAYGEHVLMLGPGQTYEQHYPFLRRMRRMDQLKRQLAHIYFERRREKERMTRPAALASLKRTRTSLTGYDYNSVFNREMAGRTSAKYRNLHQKYKKLSWELGKLEHAQSPNYYHNLMNQIYSPRISPVFTSNNRNIPRFAPQKWQMHNFRHTERIPREYVRKLLLGQTPNNLGPLSQNNRNYLRALQNTVMRRVVNAQQRFRQKKAQQVGRGLAKELNYLKYLPRPVMNFSKMGPNSVLKPSQIKLAREVARAPRFNSNNALMNYLIQGPYKSAANRAKYKRNNFSNTKKYLNYLSSGAPNNWNAF